MKVVKIYINIYMENISYCGYDKIKIEASRGAAARGVTVKPIGCGIDPHSRR